MYILLSKGQVICYRGSVELIYWQCQKMMNHLQCLLHFIMTHPWTVTFLFPPAPILLQWWILDFKASNVTIYHQLTAQSLTEETFGNTSFWEQNLAISYQHLWILFPKLYDYYRTLHVNPVSFWKGYDPTVKICYDLSVHVGRARAETNLDK